MDIDRHMSWRSSSIKETRGLATHMHEDVVPVLPLATDATDMAGETNGESLPTYPADDGPLTQAEIRAIQADADLRMPRGRVIQRRSLFS